MNKETVGAGCLAALAVIALGIVLGTLIFYLTWNDFVLHHLNGTHHASLGASLLVGLAIGALTGASNARS